MIYLRKKTRCRWFAAELAIVVSNDKTKIEECKKIHLELTLKVIRRNLRGFSICTDEPIKSIVPQFDEQV